MKPQPFVVGDNVTSRLTALQRGRGVIIGLRYSQFGNVALVHWLREGIEAMSLTKHLRRVPPVNNNRRAS